MMLVQTVTVGDRIIELYTFHGEVVDEKKWSTTQVSGGGGGINAGSGLPNQVTIASTTTTHDQFFVRNESGQEMAFEMANVGLALRKGHRVTVLWGVVKGFERGPYLAVYNHTTGDLATIQSAVENLAIPPIPMAVSIGYVAGILSICFYGIGIVVVIALLVHRSGRKKQLLAAFRPAVDTAISQIKNQK